MNTTKVLLWLAAIQLAILPLTWRESSDVPPGNYPLFDFEASEIDQIVISSSGEWAQSTTLERDGDAWVLASVGNYPADTAAVESLATKLVSLTMGREPIASRAVSHGSLGVADDSFGTRIRFRRGIEEHTLTLGPAQNGQSNLRRGEEDEVYAARGLQVSDAQASPASWVAPRLLSVDSLLLDELRIRNSHGELVLRKEGRTWTADGLSPDDELEDRVLDERVMERFLGSVTQLWVAEPAVAPPHAFEPVLARISWSAGGESGTWELGAAEGEMHYARVVGGDRVALITGANVEGALETSLDRLTTVRETP